MYALEYPWLLAALPLPLLVYWLMPPYREEQDSLRLTFFHYITASLGLRPEPGAVIPRSNWLQKIVSLLCWTLMVLALARPQFIDPPIQKIQPGRDLMLALDISQSMETRDFLTPEGKRIRRVDAVKDVVSNFIAKRKHDRIGLIVFGLAAYPVTPFTLDHQACLKILGQLDAGMAGPQTMIGDAIGLAIKEFQQSNAKDRVLILLTDGNDTGSRMPPRKAAEIAKQNGITIHVVGLGDPQNARGADKVDYAALTDIARATGGQVFHGENQVELAKAYAALDRITPQNFKTLQYRPQRELFLYPLGAALVLLTAYHLLMIVAGMVMRGVSRGRTKHEDAVTSDVFKVHV
ncbi:MAG: VWA domain-containing protein [Terracidiphilus sp.]